MSASEPNTPQPVNSTLDDDGSNVCPQCGGVLIPSHWLASVGEYPAKEVVKVPGVHCADCDYMRFEYDPHEAQP